MTTEEFGKVIAVLRSAYPNAQNFTAKESIDVWYMLLSDLDYQAASSATLKYIANNKFPPTIADIRELATEAISGKIPDWGEGYAEMNRAIHRYGYMREQEALESMSEITRATVKRMGWMNICMSENEDNQRANFRMIYLDVAQRAKTDAQTPTAVRERISQLADKLAPKQIGANNEA